MKNKSWINIKILNLLKQQERLRSKIIERLMREGSSADEPLNIPLSDYSSDEGNCSSSSDNEGKHSITASDLEGPCCAPIRAPPSSPEVMHEIRKFRVRRMHKVMHVLDQVYFSPVLQRKFKALARLKRRRQKLGCKSANFKRIAGGGGERGPSSPNGNVNEKLTASDMVERSQMGSRMPQQPSAESESTDSIGSETSELVPDVCNDTIQISKPPARKRNKKTKHMPTEKGPSKALNRKMRIDRNLRLWLANRRIFIFRRKKNRRQRVRGKPLKKRGEVTRTALDLPTTDPGSDLHFSTDDEELSPTGNVGIGVVAPLRHTLLQSELQRRYIEEIGDIVVQKPKPIHHMPPELIVTTPTKIPGPGGSKKLEVYKLTPRTAPEQQDESQLNSHSIAKGARRTYSWHNLNQESGNARQNFFTNDPKPAVKIHRAAQRHTVPSNFIPIAQQRNRNVGNADDLQLKLSLKKKIWTGTHAEPENRPLAWYKGHQSKAQAQVGNIIPLAAAAAAIRKAGGGGQQMRDMFAKRNTESLTSGGGTAMPTASAALPPTYMGAPRRPRKLEQMDLFNACSQKLLLWQQEHKKLQPMHARLMGGSSVKLESPQILRGSKPKTKTKTGSCGEVIQVNVNGSNGTKSKRKSSIIKIAETSQLVTRYSRARNNIEVCANAIVQKKQLTQMQRLIFKSQPSGVSEQIPNASTGGGGMQQSVGRATNKFKTSGIVVTALQQSAANTTGSGCVSRRIRHSSGLHIKCGGSSSGAAVGAANMLQHRNSSSSAQVNKPSGAISLDTTSLVRKVKTKLKKRKSRTLANVATAAVK